MKNAITEEEIIHSFVIQNKQARILWELGNPKKRDTVFWRFSGPDVLKPEYLVDVSSGKLSEVLHPYSSNKEVYYIGGSHIGMLSFEAAVENVRLGDICIVYFGQGHGFYQGEQENGHRPRFLLTNQ